MRGDVRRTAVGEMEGSNMTRASVRCWGYVMNGKCYRFFQMKKDFREAEVYCRNSFAGGHLASVNSATQHDQLVGLVKAANRGPTLTWLGAFDFMETGQYIWAYGSNWGYSYWMPGEPNHGKKGDDQHCLQMFMMDLKWWSLADCSKKRSFICSYPYPA
ncbi:lectin-like [Acipenser oxyrinchus oxyrinchus]|uniref:Lectin-like n=1 Tax=Acipenser oxyrinchus oxyrinchus TaxID=40147 RepID=A0AAD8G7Q7_ACIOX|nr:lectin-like [Acipenser oxyrinchus oxyrinchus]